MAKQSEKASEKEQKALPKWTPAAEMTDLQLINEAIDHLRGRVHENNNALTILRLLKVRREVARL
ncbi:MAG: hypothetical protein WC683_04485 [bacterium]